MKSFVAADPNDSFSRYALALELVKAGRDEDAALHFKEVLARDSTYVAAYYQLGGLLAKSGHVDEARDVYRRGLDAATAAAMIKELAAKFKKRSMRSIDPTSIR